MRTRLLALTAAMLIPTVTPGADAPGSPKPNDRPIPAKDAAKAMTVPDGFNVTLFAGEPDVVQPIAMAFDDRGRLWVVECLSYPKWREDGKGNDRVVILEDTDGDGKHDKRTVFLDNGSNLSGIELGFGGVWLCSLPNLLFIPVKEGEDKPAGPPEVVLDGWNLKDTKHNVFNSLAWGPDGWLYGCNGIQAKSRVGRPGAPEKDRVFFDCGVWRYHPTRKAFEVYAWGTTNPFGLDWDDRGQMFITNCVIDHLWHVVPGGHYQRMYGEDPNPHVYGYMRSCCDHVHWGGGSWTTSRSTGVGGNPQHSAAGGGHAHSGCAVYLGDNFPPEYRNSVFMCNLHGNRVNRDRLERTPAGYVARHAPDFLFANDSWFRGICIKYGPDGGLYVSDWSDTGECHNYDVADLTNGRIFKVTFGTPRPWAGDISKLPDAELAKLQLHQNDWFCRKARRVLQERAAVGKLEQGTAGALRAILKDNPDTTRKLRAMWALHAIGAMTGPDLVWALTHEDENIRAWAIALLGKPEDGPAEAWWKLEQSAAKESSPFVRLHIAGLAQRSRAELLMDQLLSWAEDLENINLNLMCWYAAETVLRGKNSASKVVLLTENSLIRRYTIRYKLTSGTREEKARQLGELIDLLGRVRNVSLRGSESLRVDILAGIQEALAGVREFPEPPGWDGIYRDLAKNGSADVRGRVETLAVIFGNQQAIADLKARITDPNSPSAARTTAVDLLARRRVDGLAPIFHGVLSDPAVRGAAVRALAAYPDPETPAKVLAAYPQFTAAEKADAVLTLASRPAFAAALLDAVEKGTIPRSDVSLVAARQVLALNDKGLTDRLGKVWGTIRPAARDRAALIQKWKRALPAEVLQKADKSNGRALFGQHCATCHKLFGEGGDVGPDLTGSQRVNLDYILENVLDPSAVVPREFQVTHFTLADGRVVSGIVLRETPDGLTVRTANDTVNVSKADIEARKQTNQSIMPEGAFDKLTPEEVRDLVAYLAAPQQVPLPKK